MLKETSLSKSRGSTHAAVSTEHCFVTDRQTDRQTDRHTTIAYRASIASRV